MSGISITAAISFGEPSAIRVAHVPAPPPGITLAPPDTTPTIKNVHSGTFSEVARRFQDYRGDPTARFVAFEQYWATYAHMAPGQLKFYFKWRNAVRSGEAPRTDLSYIFVLVYELLHLVGTHGPEDAATKLERVWRAYRTTYPKLDGYLVTWTADLLASEGRHEQAMGFIERAVADGASARDQEVLLVTDRYWERGDYLAMPRAGVSLLAGDPRLGENKFYTAHNAGLEGEAWIDRAYRDALTVTDRFVTSQDGHPPRTREIATNGLAQLSREAFQGAVYEFRRKTVTLGKVPRLPADSGMIALYRNAVRYAENFLRRHKSFSAKLRGVEVPAPLAAALDQHLTDYVRKTKPRPRVVIDLGRAAALTRESADIRARLLDGMAEAPAATNDSSVPPTLHSPPEPPPGTIGELQPPSAPAGFLTDLQAIREALSEISAPARAALETLIRLGWEASEGDPQLKSAANGALVGPLIDEVNGRVDECVGDVLIVHEGDRLVVQDDFRDEVFWVLNGTLDGFTGATGQPVPTMAASTTSSDANIPTSRTNPFDADGFGPVELEVLAILSANLGNGEGTEAALLADLARETASSPTLLIDRVNEAALASAYGDIVLEQDGARVRILDDARSYLTHLVTHTAAPTHSSDS